MHSHAENKIEAFFSKSFLPEEDGGYILYCAPGTKEEEIKAYFVCMDCQYTI